MTPTELVDLRQTPGPNYVFATDTRSNKDWQTASSVMASVGPIQQAFLVAASVWTWTHNLGYKPLVQAFDTAFNELGADIQHTSDNVVVVTHTFNATGYLRAR